MNNTERVKYKNGKIVNKRELGLVLIGTREVSESIQFSNEIMFRYTLFTELHDDGRIHIYGMKNEVMFCPMCGRRM